MKVPKQPSGRGRNSVSGAKDSNAPAQLTSKIGKGLESRVDNAVYTTKYNALTFLPIAFKEQFRRNGNVYFLFIGFLMFLGTYTELFVSSLSPWSTLGPLFLFMSISVIQEGMADLRRNQSDRERNNYPCVVLKRSEDLDSDNDREKSFMEGNDVDVRLLTQLSPDSRRSRRRNQDTEHNSAKIAFAKTKRKDIRVGDIVIVRNREMVPADLILLGSSGEKGAAYVETSSIDGETNLKLRSSPELPRGSVQVSTRDNLGRPETYSHPTQESISQAIKRVTRISLLGYADGVSALLHPSYADDEAAGPPINAPRRRSILRMASKVIGRPQPEVPDEITGSSKFVSALTSETPNASVNTFLGKITLPPVDHGVDVVNIALDAQNILLHGAVLRNTEWAIGVACFTGVETKLVQNSMKTRAKLSNLDLLINRTVVLILFLMFVIILVLSILSSLQWGKDFDNLWYAGYERNGTNSWPYLTDLDSPSWETKQKPFHQHFLGFLTLLNNFVPLSLYVTVEIASMVMMFLISWDKNMYHKETDTCAAARSTIVTDLGQVKYVFSDKTGTLTQNVMRFKRCSVDRMMFGDPVVKSAPERDEDDDFDNHVNQEFHPLKRLLNGYKSMSDEVEQKEYVKVGLKGDADDKQEIKASHQPLTFNAEFFLRVMSICHTVVVEQEMNSETVTNDSVTNDSDRSTFRFWKKSRANTGDSETNQLPTLLETTERSVEYTSRSNDKESVDVSFDSKSGSFEAMDTKESTNDAKSADGAPGGHTYQAESPDEGALVSAASQEFGFQLKGRGSGFVIISSEHPSILSNPIVSDGIKTKRVPLKNVASLMASPLMSDSNRLQNEFMMNSEEGNLTFKEPGEETWSILAVNKFDSTRKRMSIVVRSPPELGSIPMLLCKGADSSMLDPDICEGGQHLVKDSDDGSLSVPFETVAEVSENDENDDASEWEASNLIEMQSHLGAFACEGLRTLVLGVRILSEFECSEWLDQHKKAASSIVGRDSSLKALAFEIEKDLHIVGATAIEDKLQDGVPESISKIRRAGIKLWVLTGDKRETAIEIGYSTKVLDPKMYVADIADGPVGKVKALVATEFMRLVKMGKLRQYQLSALEVQKQSFCANVFKLICIFFGRFSRAYRIFYYKYVRTLCGTCYKVQSEKAIQRISEEKVIDEEPCVQRRRVRDLAEKIIEESAGRKEQRNFGSSFCVPGIFSRAKSARLLSISRQSSISELPSSQKPMLSRATSTFDPAEPSAVEEDILSVQSFVPGEIKSPFDKKKRTLLEKWFAIDRSVRKGQLVKHLTKEKEEEYYAGSHMLMQSFKAEVQIGMDENQQRSLVIEGSALLHFLGDPTLEEMLFSVANCCDAVIACRVTPQQKALLVKMVQEFVNPIPITLAIGDGANDVGMIQEAHVGIGISGLEGQQAVNASDFSIAQFRFLEDLLLVHGRWNFYRLSKVVLFSFYKNAVFAGLLIMYTPYAHYSGTTLFDQWVGGMFNFVCTAPILILGIFDRDLEKDYAKNNPHLYASGLNNEPLGLRVTFRWVAILFIHVILIFFTTFDTLGNVGGGGTSAFKGLMHNKTAPGDGEGDSVIVYGTLIFMILNWTFAFKVLLESGSIIHGVWPAFTCKKNVGEGFWNRVAYSWHGVIFLSIGFNFFFFYIYQLIGCLGPDTMPSSMSGFVMVAYHMLHTRSISWVVLFIVTLLAIIVDVVLKVYSNMFYPTQTQIHREKQLKTVHQAVETHDFSA